MAMLWMPAAHGQTPGDSRGSMNWMGRLLAMPGGTLHASATAHRKNMPTATIYRMTPGWMPHGLGLWISTAVHLGPNCCHGYVHNSDFAHFSAPCSVARLAVTHIGPDRRRMLTRVFAARPPPCML